MEAIDKAIKIWVGSSKVKLRGYGYSTRLGSRGRSKGSARGVGIARKSYRSAEYSTGISDFAVGDHGTGDTGLLIAVVKSGYGMKFHMLGPSATDSPSIAMCINTYQRKSMIRDVEGGAYGMVHDPSAELHCADPLICKVQRRRHPIRNILAPGDKREPLIFQLFKGRGEKQNIHFAASALA